MRTARTFGTMGPGGIFMMRKLGVGLCGFILLGTAAALHAQVSVRQRPAAGPYDPVTVELAGPLLNEAAGINPFADYRLDVTFSDGTGSFSVPGYFAGCADAADRRCTGGRTWKAHFVPSHGGSWSYSVRFRTGRDIVPTGGAGAAVTGLDGASGLFTVGDQPRNNVRARGLLSYAGESYYLWSGDKWPFFKFGPDSPENMLAYAGFDATPNAKKLRKSWTPHERDFDARASAYLWNGDRGKGLLGMFRYLADQRLNSVSMLLFNVGGDDQNVVPHLLKVSPETYAALEPKAQWNDGVVHDRFDLSKLAQWQRALSYADELGLHLHFKLAETENDLFMDGGTMGRERKIYLREMVARFNHFLAVTWNLGEESHQPAPSLIEQSRYVAGLDPYDHPLVLHTYPHEKEIYRPLLGNHCALNGLSLQGIFPDFRDLRADVIKWRAESRSAGRPWAIGYDEQGGAQGGAPVDLDYPAERMPDPKRGVEIAPDLFRRAALWNALTSGSFGLEAYYGYRTGCTDLNCEDQRTRASLWRDGAAALAFFDRHVGTEALRMEAADDLTPNPDDFVFADLGRLYVIYTTPNVPSALPLNYNQHFGNQAGVRLQLFGQTGDYSVGWYDARIGGDLQMTPIARVAGGGMANLGKPPEGGSGEWAVVVRRED